jgi:hypothetical protein
MSQEIDLCRDSRRRRRRPNNESLSCLPLSRKRPRDNEVSSNDDHPRNESGPGDKNATGLTEFLTEKDVDSEDSEHTSRDEGRVCKQAFPETIDLETTVKRVGAAMEGLRLG